MFKSYKTTGKTTIIIINYPYTHLISDNVKVFNRIKYKSGQEV